MLICFKVKSTDPCTEDKISNFKSSISIVMSNCIVK